MITPFLTSGRFADKVDRVTKLLWRWNVREIALSITLIHLPMANLLATTVVDNPWVPVKPELAPQVRYQCRGMDGRPDLHQVRIQSLDSRRPKNPICFTRDLPRTYNMKLTGLLRKI